MLRASTVACVLLAGTGAALAQSAHPAQPYAELRTRAIKALSAEQVADLRAGRGMGLALAAELNGYPGPSHVLKQADELGLAPVQRARAALRAAHLRYHVAMLEVLTPEQVQRYGTLRGYGVAAPPPGHGCHAH